MYVIEHNPPIRSRIRLKPSCRFRLPDQTASRPSCRYRLPSWKATAASRTRPSGYRFRYRFSWLAIAARDPWQAFQASRAAARAHFQVLPQPFSRPRPRLGVRSFCFVLFVSPFCSIDSPHPELFDSPFCVRYLVFVLFRRPRPRPWFPRNIVRARPLYFEPFN